MSYAHIRKSLFSALKTLNDAGADISAAVAIRCLERGYLNLRFGRGIEVTIQRVEHETGTELLTKLHVASGGTLSVAGAVAFAARLNRVVLALGEAEEDLIRCSSHFATVSFIPKPALEERAKRLAEMKTAEDALMVLDEFWGEWIK